MAKSEKTTKRQDLKLPRKSINRRVREKPIEMLQSRRMSLRLQLKNKLETVHLPPKESPRKKQTNLVKQSTKIESDLKPVRNFASKTQRKTSKKRSSVLWTQPKRGSVIQRNDKGKSRSKTHENKLKKTTCLKASRNYSINSAHSKGPHREPINRKTKAEVTMKFRAKALPKAVKAQGKLSQKAITKTASKTPRKIAKVSKKVHETHENKLKKTTLKAGLKASRNSSIKSAHSKRPHREPINRQTKAEFTMKLRADALPKAVKAQGKLSQKAITKTASKTPRKCAKVSKKAKVTTKKSSNHPKNLKTRMKIKSKTTSDVELDTKRLAQIFNAPTTITSRNSNEVASKRRMKRRTSLRINSLQPLIVKRNNPIQKQNSDIQLAKETLHVSSVPKTLLCREKEFKEIYNFIESNILDDTGGCMHVSGSPGTGKTSTVTKVIKSLSLQVAQQKLPEFTYIEINGMRLTDPRLAYVQIYHQLTSESVPWQQAHSLLEDLFKNASSKRKITVLLVDEFDELAKSYRQDVLYNLLDWATKRNARLLVIAIANIIHPGRLLKPGITSRLGSTRIIFQPYTQNQLHAIVQARLEGINIFQSDAVQLVARKVASISGDCRRALDICRRAVEIGGIDCAGQEVMISMSHVQKAFDEMITSPKIIGVKGSSKHEKLFLQAVAAEVARTGVDETVLFQVYRQFETICALNGVNVPEPGIALRISCRLGSSGLLICEHSSASIHQKIMLNVTQDELHYAYDVSN